MKHKILLVDDDELWLIDLQHLLCKDFELVTAKSVVEASNRLEGEDDIALALVDVLLPYGDGQNEPRRGGLDFLLLVQNKGNPIPLVFMSGYDNTTRFRATGYELYSKWSILRNKERFVETLSEEIERFQAKAPNNFVNPIQDVIEELRVEVERLQKIKEEEIDIPREGRYKLLKPLKGFKDEIEEKLVQYPFHKNVFVMMKFRGYNKNLFDFISDRLELKGLRAVRADQDKWDITRNIFNPIAVLYCCKFGIALFDEPEKGQHYSPNVAYELGIMHYQEKNCLILRHSSLMETPFDLVKDLYCTYTKELEVKEYVDRWIGKIT